MRRARIVAPAIGETVIQRLHKIATRREQRSTESGARWVVTPVRNGALSHN
jgi:hypothetical protein